MNFTGCLKLNAEEFNKYLEELKEDIDEESGESVLDLKWEIPRVRECRFNSETKKLELIEVKETGEGYEDLRKCETELGRCKQLLSGYTEEKQRVSKRRAELAEKLRNLEAKGRGKSPEAESIKKELEQQTEALEECQRKLKDTETERSLLSDQYTKLNNKYRELQDKIDIVNKQVVELTRLADSRAKEIEELKSKKELTPEESGRLEECLKDVETLTKQVDDCEEAKDALVKQIEELAKEEISKVPTEKKEKPKEKKKFVSSREEAREIAIKAWEEELVKVGGTPFSEAEKARMILPELRERFRRKLKEAEKTRKEARVEAVRPIVEKKMKEIEEREVKFPTSLIKQFNIDDLYKGLIPVRINALEVEVKHIAISEDRKKALYSILTEMRKKLINYRLNHQQIIDQVNSLMNELVEFGQLKSYKEEEK